MADIVERLRDLAAIDNCQASLEAANLIERLRAALRNAYEVYAGSDGFIPETAAEGYQQQIIKQMVDCISAALEEGMTSPDEREDCTGLEDSSTANPCGREDCEEKGRT